MRACFRSAAAESTWPPESSPVRGVLEERQHRAEGGFPVAAADLEIDHADLAPAVLMCGPVDPADDALLPGVKLERLTRRAALRMPQEAEEFLTARSP